MSDWLLGYIAGCFVFSIILIIILLNLPHFYYRRGQIDALTGNIKYELVEHQDNTKTWERIEDEK